MPTTTTPTELQRNYSEVKRKVRDAQGPVIVMSNNVPDMVIFNFDVFQKGLVSTMPNQSKNYTSVFDDLCGSIDDKEYQRIEKALEDFEIIDE